MSETDTAEAPVVAPPAEARPDPERVLLHMPVDVRSVSLATLAGLALLFVLHWAKAVFIPVMVSVLFSYALTPLVNWLENRKIPRWLSSAVLLIAVFSSIGLTGYGLKDQASGLIEALPVAAEKVTRAIRAQRGKSDSPLETVQKAASQIEQAAQESAAANNRARGAMRVIVEPTRFNVRDFLWSGTLGLVALIGQTMAVLFLTYFLLLSGDTFRRKLVKLAGDSLSSKKVTLQALHEITDQIQHYLGVQILTSLMVGALTWIALLMIGLENAAVWGITAAVLNLVPYAGSVITAAASALVGFLQFGTINMALLVGGSSLAIHTIIGNLVTPWLTSRTSRLSPVAVFVALLAWGWLWGIWGLLLGVPIMMIVKSVCDRVDHLKPLGEFLGS